MGLPENAAKLIAQVTAHDALLVASPEYNSMITPLLKNTIDWCTRADDNPFEGKVAAVISASPGPYGGVRSLADGPAAPPEARMPRRAGPVHPGPRGQGL